MSLIIYPIIITGLLQYRAGRVGPGFWAACWQRPSAVVFSTEVTKAF
jgi:hypothetical protein